MRKTSLFHPDFHFHRVMEITPAFLAENRIKGLVLDVDNTLAKIDDKDPQDGIVQWIRLMKNSGIRLVILSNNWAKRVGEFASVVGLPFVAVGLKPLKFQYYKTFQLLRLRPQSVAMVGDQILTDVVGGNRVGMQTILVDPFHLAAKKNPVVKVKRKIEDHYFAQFDAGQKAEKQAKKIPMRQRPHKNGETGKKH